jgi:hypothetical protein
MSSLYQMVVLIKGGGEMASAVAHRLGRTMLVIPDKC